MLPFFARPLTRREMALGCAVLSLALLLSTLPAALHWGQAQLDTGALLCADTLRFHIRADSDSPADQTVKLAVRDAVLAYADVHCTAQDKPAALRWAAENLPALELTPGPCWQGGGSFPPLRYSWWKCTLIPLAIPPASCPPGGIMPCASTWAATPATAKTGGACSTRACAALPAAPTPCRRKTIWCVGRMWCGSSAWSGGSG